MNTETLSAQQRLARNRQAMVSHLRGRNQPETFRADDGTVYSADPESPTFSTADGVLPMLKRAAVTWWHFHPARQALLIAEPSLAHYAQRKPWQLMGIAAISPGAPAMKPEIPAAGSPSYQPMQLDEAALRAAATTDLGDGPVTPGYGSHREDIIKLLNDALATELVCVLRYKRHYFTVDGRESPAIKEEFLVHANEEAAHSDKLAERIVQLGGEPDYSPNTLLQRSHADYDTSSDLQSMIRANLVAERVAVEAYRQMIQLIGDKDPTTRRMLEEILADEEEHADELKDWLHR
jgi:bacterioferritin